MLEAILELRAPYYCVLAAAGEMEGQISVSSLCVKNDYIHHLLEIKNSKVSKGFQVADVLRKYSVNVSNVNVIRKGLFMTVAETPYCRLYSCVINNGCFLLREYGYHGNQYIRWRLISPSRKNLNELLRDLRKLGSDARVITIDEPPKRRLLTEKQEKVLRTAIESGYFNTPKESSAKNVAKKLHISTSTFSEILRRALKKIVEYYLNGP